MGKASRAIVCQYCSRPFSSIKSLESHWAQQRHCAKKRQADLNQFNYDLERLANPPNDPVPPSPSAPASPTLVPDPEESTSDVEMIGDEPACRSPGVTIEEIEDEDALHPPVSVLELNTQQVLIARHYSNGDLTRLRDLHHIQSLLSPTPTPPPAPRLPGSQSASMPLLFSTAS